MVVESIKIYKKPYHNFMDSKVYKMRITKSEFKYKIEQTFSSKTVLKQHINDLHLFYDHLEKKTKRYTVMKPVIIKIFNLKSRYKITVIIILQFLHTLNVC